MVICIVLIIILLLCYLIFCPHILRVLRQNSVIIVYFGIFKVLDSRKKKVKAEEQRAYVKVPTADTVKKLITAVPYVYKAEKDNVINVLKELIHNCHLKRLDASLNYGTGDAALTAISYGFLWQLVSVFYASVIKDADLKKNINVAIKPDYEEFLFDYKIDLKLKITVSKHLLLLLRAYKILKRIKEKLN